MMREQMLPEQSSECAVEIELKMFMKFKRFLPEGSRDGKAAVSQPEGATFEDLLHLIGMPPADDKIIVINGISHKQTREINNLVLHQGDVVAIFPPIAGG